jgi:hypothetical protein
MNLVADTIAAMFAYKASARDLNQEMFDLPPMNWFKLIHSFRSASSRRVASTRIQKWFGSASGSS